MSMVPALVLPPKWFYAGRQWLGSQDWYKRARAEAVPIPGFTRSMEVNFSFVQEPVARESVMQ